MTTAAPVEVPVHIKLRGDNYRAYKATDPEILLEGAARTGKTYAILLRMVRNAQTIPGYRGAIVRKVAARLGDTVLQTLQDDVLHEWDKGSNSSALDHVHYFGGNRHDPPAYQFANGSVIVVGGMDNPSKILGAEYDEVFANQVEELAVEDIETLLSRLSHGLMSPSFLADCNPTYDRHWVIQRARSGRMRHLRSTLKDNPAFYDDDGVPTPRGEGYLRSIEGMTGTRYQRLVLGEWVGMEDAIYADLLDAQTMLVPIPENTQWTGRAITGVDYGETPAHPSTVGTITEATTGVWWVRECWAETGGNTRAIEDAVRAQGVRYGATIVMTDPTIRAYASSKGWQAADGAAGSRSTRVGHVTKLLEAKALKFDKFGDGIQELWDEMHMYRWVTIESNTEIKQVPWRDGEDRVAQLEYAVEGSVMGLQLPAGIGTRRVQRSPRERYKMVG